MNNELPDQYVIPVMKTFEALCNVKVRKATGPDNIPAWLLKSHAEVLAPPLTAIFNNSLREGVVPIEWKTAKVIPLYRYLKETRPCQLKKILDQFN